MFLNHSEWIAVRGVCAEGRAYGYGNLISRLQAAWALELLRKNPDFTVEDALSAGRCDLTVSKARDEAIVFLRKYTAQGAIPDGL